MKAVDAEVKEAAVKEAQRAALEEATGFQAADLLVAGLNAHAHALDRATVAAGEATAVKAAAGLTALDGATVAVDGARTLEAASGLHAPAVKRDYDAAGRVLELIQKIS